MDTYLYEHFGNKVRVLRNSKREGLIRSRMHGASKATGDVLIFLDSHIEATTGWIEPLLDLIKRNETNVVTPIIDNIDKQTFEYKYAINKFVSVGGFDWNLIFTWHGLPKREYSERKSDHDPVRSPTMVNNEIELIWLKYIYIYIFTCQLISKGGWVICNVKGLF